MSNQVTFSISQLSKLAGISVRTLHHYDDIGLLKPSRRKDNGYREYNETQLVLLQQILIYRALDFSTKEIKGLLHSESFDLRCVLQAQKNLLLSRQQNLQSMINNIEVSMNNLNIKENLEALYNGIPKEKAERWNMEAREKYGNASVNEAQKRIEKMSKEKAIQVKLQGEKIAADIAQLLSKSVTCDAVQAVVEKHFNWVENFTTSTYESYTNLACLYVESREFTEFYDKHGKGAARHLSEAIIVYAKGRFT